MVDGHTISALLTHPVLVCAAVVSNDEFVCSTIWYIRARKKKIGFRNMKLNTAHATHSSVRLDVDVPTQ